MAKIALGVLKKVLEMEEKGELEKHVKEGEGKDEGETENTFEDGEEEAAEDTQPVKEDGIQGEARSGDADEEILENREVNTADPTPITADTQASSHPEVDWNYTIATLDMIVSIIGDFFGQRDLLEERSLLGNKWMDGWLELVIDTI